MIVLSYDDTSALVLPKLSRQTHSASGFVMKNVKLSNVVRGSFFKHPKPSKDEKIPISIDHVVLFFEQWEKIRVNGTLVWRIPPSAKAELIRKVLDIFGPPSEP